jgi:hypothetical protein
MTPAERVVMIDRGRADLSVASAMCAAGIGALRIYRQPAARIPAR